MEENLLDRILRERQVKLSELPDDFDIESLPDDVVLIFEDNHDESLSDDFWNDEE